MVDVDSLKPGDLIAYSEMLWYEVIHVDKHEIKLHCIKWDAQNGMKDWHRVGGIELYDKFAFRYAKLLSQQ